MTFPRDVVFRSQVRYGRYGVGDATSDAAGNPPATSTTGGAIGPVFSTLKNVTSAQLTAAITQLTTGVCAETVACIQSSCLDAGGNFTANAPASDGSIALSCNSKNLIDDPTSINDIGSWCQSLPGAIASQQNDGGGGPKSIVNLFNYAEHTYTSCAYTIPAPGTNLGGTSTDCLAAAQTTCLTQGGAWNTTTNVCTPTGGVAPYVVTKNPTTLLCNQGPVAAPLTTSSSGAVAGTIGVVAVLGAAFYAWRKGLL